MRRPPPPSPLSLLSVCLSLLPRAETENLTRLPCQAGHQLSAPPRCCHHAPPHHADAANRRQTTAANWTPACPSLRIANRHGTPPTADRQPPRARQHRWTIERTQPVWRRQVTRSHDHSGPLLQTITTLPPPLAEQPTELLSIVTRSRGGRGASHQSAPAARQKWAITDSTASLLLAACLLAHTSIARRSVPAPGSTVFLDPWASPWWLCH